jgi:peptide chain release factor 1
VLCDPPPVPGRLLAGGVRVETMRGRGRGGQRKNKVETAVRVTHLATGVSAARSAGRSQAANLASARAQLEQELRARAGQAALAEAGRQRRAQTRRGPQARVFTHSEQRGRVTDHCSGREWDMRAWQQGRFGDAPGPG